MHYPETEAWFYDEEVQASRRENGDQPGGPDIARQGLKNDNKKVNGSGNAEAQAEFITKQGEQPDDQTAGQCVLGGLGPAAAVNSVHGQGSLTLILAWGGLGLGLGAV